MSSACCTGQIIRRKAVALIQARGMPIDVPLWNLVQENKAAVIGALLQQYDPSFGSENPIYTPEGEWSYARFENWLVAAGVQAGRALTVGSSTLTATPSASCTTCLGSKGCTRYATRWA